jgi:hypothetical protein
MSAVKYVTHFNVMPSMISLGNKSSLWLPALQAGQPESIVFSSIRSMHFGDLSKHNGGGQRVNRSESS